MLVVVVVEFDPFYYSFCFDFPSVVLLIPFRFPVLWSYYWFRFGFPSRGCSSFCLLLTLVLVVLLVRVLLFQPLLFIVFDLHHKTTNRDHPTRRPFCTNLSLSRVVPDLALPLYVPFLFVFFLLRWLYSYSYSPLCCDRGIDTYFDSNAPLSPADLPIKSIRH